MVKCQIQTSMSCLQCFWQHFQGCHQIYPAHLSSGTVHTKNRHENKNQSCIHLLRNTCTLIKTSASKCFKISSFNLLGQKGNSEIFSLNIHHDNICSHILSLQIALVLNHAQILCRYHYHFNYSCHVAMTRVVSDPSWWDPARTGFFKLKSEQIIQWCRIFYDVSKRFHRV